MRDKCVCLPYAYECYYYPMLNSHDLSERLLSVLRVLGTVLEIWFLLAVLLASAFARAFNDSGTENQFSWWNLLPSVLLIIPSIYFLMRYLHRNGKYRIAIVCMSVILLVLLLYMLFAFSVIVNNAFFSPNIIPHPQQAVILKVQ